jgi:SP family facilitated glucose transporter-like MFS transporter 1
MQAASCDVIVSLQVMFFSTKIFRMAQLDDKNAQYATLGMGAVNVFMTLVSMVIVEKAGRKTLLLVGFAGMCCTTILLTISLAYVQVLIICYAVLFIYSRCI